MAKELTYCALSILISITFLSSCKQKSASDIEKENMEVQAGMHLDSARAALYKHDYDKAREQISTLRQTCRRAITARRNAILLLDSIDLQEAQSELQKTDSLFQIEKTKELEKEFEELCEKVKFYHRKLQHDLNQTIMQ